MHLIGVSLPSDAQARMEQMGICYIDDLALLQESDVDHIFLDKKDILKHRRLVKIITVLHLELTPSGQRQFFMTDTMATVEDRILNRRYLATEYRMARSSDSTCLSCCIIFTSGLFLGAFLLLHLMQY